MTAGSLDKAADGAAAVAALGDAPVLLTELIRERTHTLHSQAERSGIINDVLRGKASRYGYALLLRNLLPAYRRLEAGLEAHRHLPGLRAVARRELYRAPAITADLKELIGPEWESALPLLPAGERYGWRVAVAADVSDGAGLVAHAYTRYLGDLSGGQVLKRLLARTLGLQAQELSFLEFSEIDDPQAFKKDYRRALDLSAATIVDINAVVVEAMAAFELNIAVSEAVQQASMTAA